MNELSDSESIAKLQSDIEDLSHLIVSCGYKEVLLANTWLQPACKMNELIDSKPIAELQSDIEDSTRGMSDSYSLSSSASTKGQCLFCNQVSSFLFTPVAVSKTLLWVH